MGTKESLKNKKELKNIEIELANSLEDWQRIKEFGCNDPFWEDGANMYLVRNHILYYKQKIKELCTAERLPLPDIYYEPTPPEVEQKYMARADQIREEARKILNTYLADKSYQQLKNIVGIKNKGKRETLQIVLSRVEELKQAIKKDDLVTMRRHTRPDITRSNLESFKSLADNITEKDFEGQVSIFEAFGVVP